MRKYIYAISVVTLAYFLMQIAACNNDNNPVILQERFPILDSNVFDWRIDTVYTNISKDFYVGDTNKIFIPGNPYSVYINVSSIQYINHNDPDFSAFCANGIDINNVYIGGNLQYTNKAKLKKWNGLTIEDIPMPNDTSGKISRIEPISTNDIWMTTASNIIYRYFNNSIITYTLDSNLDYGTIYEDNNGKLYAQFIEYQTGISKNSFYMYEFVNNIWTKIWKDDFDDSSEMGYFIGFSNHKMLRSGKSCIYYFTGNNWEKYVYFGNELNPLNNAAGGSPENILFNAQEKNQLFTFFFNGKQIFRLPFNEIIGGSSIICFNYTYGRYYIATDYSQYQGYFAFAKLKK